MGKITFALGIPHTPWIPERVASFGALIDSLDFAYPNMRPACLLDLHVFGEKAPNHEWSKRMWEWACDTRVTHFIQLQDDVEVRPRFWEIVKALVTAQPDSIIGLHSPCGINVNHGSLYATKDGLIGTGYIVPIAELKRFLFWCDNSVSEAGIQSLGEDTLLGLYAYVFGLPILHPFPSFIRHNTDIASTYGNDAHEGRQPFTPYTEVGGGILERMTQSAYWCCDTPPAQRYYTATQKHALRYVKGFDPQRYLRDSDQIAADQKRKALMQATIRPRIVIATPTRDGMVSELYLHTICKLYRWADIHVMRVSTHDDDVDRARSRQVRRFLEDDNGTHLLFIDSDVGFEPALLQGMVAAAVKGGHDYVAAAYPRGGIHWERVAFSVGPEDAEAKAYDYPIRLLEGVGLPEIDAYGCCEVAGVGLGCTLLSRKLLETVSADVAEFDDLADGTKTPAVFERTWVGSEWLSEDYSFGHACRVDHGYKVMLYMGAGAPASHAKMGVLRGMAAAFGMRDK